MAKNLNEKIVEDRLLKQNPYAHLDEYGTYSALPHISQDIELAKKIHESRLLLQNPYAYLNESGSYSALPSKLSLTTLMDAIPINIINPNPKDHYSDTEIEKVARNIQTHMWRERNHLLDEGEAINPIKILDPEMAFMTIGYEFDFEETLGQFIQEGEQFEVAGIIDRDLRKVSISRQFPTFIRSFTSAHELGHALLHRGSGLHRDRPINGEPLPRKLIEMEADKFATYFLMPKKLVKNIFKQIFLSDEFILSEETAFALNNGLDRLQKMSLRELSRLLASTERFNGTHFISIANQFNVSVEAMAIRLEELQLIQT